MERNRLYGLLSFTNLLLLILLIPVYLQGSPLISGYDNRILLNGIVFSLSPYVEIQNAHNTYSCLSFTTDSIDYADSCMITFTSDQMDIYISLIPKTSYTVQTWQMAIKTEYKTDLLLHDVQLRVSLPYVPNHRIYKGITAIESRDESKNLDLCNYRDKVLAYEANGRSVYLMASNYSETRNIERISSNALHLYDYRLHFSRLYRAAGNAFDILIDYKPVSAGDTDTWSALLMESKPPLVAISRWPNGKKAAFALTSDGDGENLIRERTFFYGAGNTEHPDYGQKGLIPNHLKMSHTVFGMNHTFMRDLWHAVAAAGTSIGLHSYNPDTPDSTHVYANCLTNEMADFNIRMWIDHSWGSNPEDLCYEGGNPASPYYLLDVINQSQIDYAWCGDKPENNPFDAFDEPWRLPHRQYYFTGLSRPVWFYGRTRMETWEYLTGTDFLDMKNVLTPQNLDNLLRQGGLCVGYTHVNFINNSIRLAFHIIDDEGNCLIRPEVEELLQVLNDYQNLRGLWIDTAENIFDRMLAIEKLEITNITRSELPGYYQITLKNNSDFHLTELSLKIQQQQFYLPSLNAGESVILNHAQIPDENSNTYQYYLKYHNNALFIRSLQDYDLPPMQIHVYNLKGQKVLSYDNQAETANLSLPFTAYGSGLYLVKITPNSGKAVLQKVSVIK